MTTSTTNQPEKKPGLVGYAEPWSVAAGETVDFMVGSDHATYQASLVELIHGDDRPEAPGLKERDIESSLEGEYRGMPPIYPVGSMIVVEDHPALRLGASFSLAGWFMPTTPGEGHQGLLTKWAANRVGYGLGLDASGALCLRIGDQTGAIEASTEVPVRGGQWYLLVGVFDGAAGEIRLHQRPYPVWPLDPTLADREVDVSIAEPQHEAVPLTMAAWSNDPKLPRSHFNGRIEAPGVYDRALTTHDIEALFGGSTVDGRRAGWDLARDTSTSSVRDVVGSCDGRTVNMPTRGMTGHLYRGDEEAWTRDPETHGAIHFHEDDLEDCGWDVAFSLTIPSDMTSGIYAARLTAGEQRFHIPVFVRPPARRATNTTLFLAPTNSYLAYANFREDLADRHGVLGLYHNHRDGSPVVYSSSRRPITNLRPGALFNILGDEGAPHQFNADLHLVDWMTHQGFGFDVAIDSDLDQEGNGLLSQYRVVVTGSHPEYWTGAMLDALEGYLHGGGRLMYLGGNGLIWVTSFDPERRHVIEVRKGSGGRNIVAGVSHHSTTGEAGGYWRRRGRASNRLIGVGSIAQGFDRSAPYRRTAESHDPRVAWIFEGVDGDTIGAFGLTMGGAAGFEIDCTDPELGTPPHAITIARADEFSSTYEHQNPVHVAGTDIDRHDPMRSDMVFFETPNGGAVFSVGSIAYCGALSHNDYDNSVSRITGNVMRRFNDEAPFAEENL